MNMNVSFSSLRDEYPTFSIVDVTQGSDYSGGIYNAAAYSYMRQNFLDHPDVLFVSGMLFSYAVAYNRDTKCKDLKMALQNLDALIEHSDIIQDMRDLWENDAWNDTHESEYIYNLRGMFPDRNIIGHGYLNRIFWDAAEEAGVHWEHYHSNAWIDVDAVTEYIKQHKMKELTETLDFLLPYLEPASMI